MRHLAIALFALLGSIASFAQDSPAYHACTDKAVAQADLNSCAGDEATRVEAELNRVYATLLSKAAGDQVAVAKIKAAERAWIGYRDAYLEAMYPAKDKQAEYGSIYAMEISLLRAKLTQRQIVALQELLEQYSSDS
ncbi:MAG TPA: lysozyme inhibitor LprI family protein [Terriglobales bacterium]|nr:lysozyme inhibitor LprI family protein [Terriglobales bacterium]